MKLTKKDIFTIPNILSYFRLLLIPFIIWSYCFLDNYTLTIIFIAISAFSDILDGYIARKFNMMSDFGKFIDPVADWLTQFALVICVLFKYKIMWIILILFVLRQITMFLLGLWVYKKIDKVNSSRWYGKLNTVLIDTTMGVLILFPSVPEFIINSMVIICSISIVVSLFLYWNLYVNVVRDNTNEEKKVVDN